MSVNSSKAKNALKQFCNTNVQNKGGGLLNIVKKTALLVREGFPKENEKKTIRSNNSPIRAELMMTDEKDKKRSIIFSSQAPFCNLTYGRFWLQTWVSSGHF